MAMGKEEQTKILTASIEAYVDKKIASGLLDSSQRDVAIAQYKLQARIN